MQTEPHVVIVGGGFSGAAVAIHLLRLASVGVRVTLLEPREVLFTDTPVRTPVAAALKPLAPDAQVRGLHVALVDDVLTTGATAQSLALVLLKAGAKRVDVYCLARTPKPDGPA